jgi:hypothetical protein
MADKSRVLNWFNNSKYMPVGEYDVFVLEDADADGKQGAKCVRFESTMNQHSGRMDVAAHTALLFIKGSTRQYKMRPTGTGRILNKSDGEWLSGEIGNIVCKKALFWSEL